MYPSQLPQIVWERIDDLRQDAAAVSAARQVRPTRPGRAAIRRRAGWTLIHIGLRLAASSPDA